MALCAAQSRGTMSSLLADVHHLSPALGLLALHSHVFTGNLRRSHTQGGCGWGLGPSSALARAIYSQRSRGDTLRPTRNRSHAAAHLQPDTIGVILGLGITRAKPERVRERLKRAGIETNRVRGARTGVSMQRYIQLVDSIAGACADGGETAPAVQCMLRLAWERSETKRDLLDFLLALDEERPVLADRRLRDDTAAQDAWVQHSFEPSDICDSRVEHALEILAGGEAPASGGALLLSSEVSAEAFEIVAAGLSQAHAVRPPLRVHRHSFEGAPVKPDCVEVAVREVIELLLFAPAQGRFDLSRLPASANPALRAFYGDGGAADEREASKSQKFFEMCQDHPQLHCHDYLSATADGKRFELRPTMRTVASATAALLGLRAEGTQPPISSLAELQAAWNALQPPEAKLEVMEEEGGSGWADGVDRATLREAAVPSRVTTHRCYPALPEAAGVRAVTTSIVAAARTELASGAVVRRASAELPATAEGASAVTVHVEAARLQLHGAPLGIELRLLDGVMYHVSVTHRATRPLRAAFDSQRSKHLELWRRARGEPPARQPALAVLWPSLLGDGMLRALPANPSRRQLLQAVFASRWGGDARRWLPLAEDTNIASLPGEVVAADTAIDAASTRTLAAICALRDQALFGGVSDESVSEAHVVEVSHGAARSSDADGVDTNHALDPCVVDLVNVLADVIEDAPQTIDAAALATSLTASGRPDAARDRALAELCLQHEGMRRALAQRADGSLVVAMLKHRALGHSFRVARRGLALSETLTLLRYAVARRVFS